MEIERESVNLKTDQYKLFNLKNREEKTNQKSGTSGTCETSKYLIYF